MGSMMDELWNLALPIVGGALCTLAVTLITWASHAVRSSEWYATRSPFHRKLIDFFAVVVLGWVSKRIVWSKDIEIALQRPVQDLTPTAKEKKKATGKMPLSDKILLDDAATQAAMETLSVERPEIFKKIPLSEISKTIRNTIPKVVDKENAKAKRDSRRTGGHSPGGYRP